MKVFLSWSGAKSKLLAEALREWLPQVIQAVDAWVSSDDIEKGVRWGHEIAAKLEESKVGVICLTRDNLQSPWILFEAGALSRANGAHVCTLLFNVDPTDVRPPLAQFQHATTSKGQIRELVHTINSVVQSAGEKSLSEFSLRNVFDTFWPQLDAALESIETQSKALEPPLRSDSDILKEILNLARLLERRQRKDFDKSLVSQMKMLAENHTGLSGEEAFKLAVRELERMQQTLKA